MGRYAYLSALRGIAILGVIIVHVSQAVPDLPHFARLLADQGARGVQLFFVVSAFTLMLSWHRRNDGTLPFYVRRLFRIAPIFWLAIVGFLILHGFGPRYWAPDGIDWRHVLATTTFMHGWHPATITSVVPGGWTIANEMIFYALFPAIALSCTRWQHAIMLLIGSMLLFLSVASKTLIWPGFEPAYLASNYRFLFFFSQLPVFMVGVAVYFIALHAVMWPRWIALGLVGLSVAAIFLIPFVQEVVPYSITQSRWGHIAYGLVFGALLAGLSVTSGGAGLMSRILGWMGDRSFSAYLWHFAILSMVSTIGVDGMVQDWWPAGVRFAFYFVLVGVLTFAASAVTFKFIEQPMIRLGHQLAKRLAAKQARFQIA